MEQKTLGQRCSKKYEANGSMSQHNATDIMVWWEMLGWKEDRKPLLKFLNTGEIPGYLGKRDE